MKLADPLFAQPRQPCSALNLHSAKRHPLAGTHCATPCGPGVKARAAYTSCCHITESSHPRSRSTSTRLHCSTSAAAPGNEEWEWKVSTVKRILAFMGPALIIPLGDPLMSLTDTVFMGQVGWLELLVTGMQRASSAVCVRTMSCIVAMEENHSRGLIT